MKKQANETQKLGAFVRHFAPFFLFIGPILIVVGIGASFWGLIGAILLGFGLLDMSFRRR
jgi:hypothetical protein